MQTLVSVLDDAYRWLCWQRRDHPPDADVWHLRFHWHTERIRLEAELSSGRYRFGPLSVITKTDGEGLHLWGARDALVLKARARRGSAPGALAALRARERTRRASKQPSGTCSNACRTMATCCAPT